MWSLSRPAIAYCCARGGLESFDERAAFEVGEDRVELVGYLLELGQQIALLGDGFVDGFLRGLLGLVLHRAWPGR